MCSRVFVFFIQAQYRQVAAAEVQLLNQGDYFYEQCSEISDEQYLVLTVFLQCCDLDSCLLKLNRKILLNLVMKLQT